MRTAARPDHSIALGDSLSDYLERISEFRLITREEEGELARRIRDGHHEAVDALVCANLRFVVSIAKRYQHQGLALSDLISEGNMGLMRAAERFDERKGVRFISYAVWWVRQAMLQALSEQGHVVRVPVGQAQTIRLAAFSSVSLDAPFSDDDRTSFADVLPDEHAPAPDEAASDGVLTRTIEEALSQLRPREAAILRLYFGLDGHDAMTLEQIGLRLGVTRERVRQLRDKALWRLRTGGARRKLAACGN